ncbi:MAG: DinB family protein [Gemmatimonadaceae bacterium]
MNTINVLLAELEAEAHATERVLARVPQEHLSWRPHPKSFSLGQLALHVATIPGNVAAMTALDTFADPPQGAQAEATSADELVSTMKASVAQAREILGGFDDEAMAATWRMTIGGKEIMAMPRSSLARVVMLNHWYHHRGQLMVYLRLHDVPLPSVYGPTADENPFMA